MNAFAAWLLTEKSPQQFGAPHSKHKSLLGQNLGTIPTGLLLESFDQRPLPQLVRVTPKRTESKTHWARPGSKMSPFERLFHMGRSRWKKPIWVVLSASSGLRPCYGAGACQRTERQNKQLWPKLGEHSQSSRAASSPQRKTAGWEVSGIWEAKFSSPKNRVNDR